MRSNTAARSSDAAETRRDQILDAARAAIEEYGPGALTGQIAERAGLARPNVYRHFPSKEALDFALAHRAYQELRAVIREMLAVTGTPLEVIRASVTAQVEWADEHPNLYRFLVSRGHQRTTPQPRADRRHFATEIASAAVRYFPRFGDDPDAAEATIIALVGMVDASVLWWLDRRIGTRAELIERLTMQLWLILDYRLREIGVIANPSTLLPHAARANGE